MSGADDDANLICLSHLRWDFAYQRPQHLMSRFARRSRVFFVEDPVYGVDPARFSITPREDSLHVVVPYLPKAVASTPATERLMKRLLDDPLESQRVRDVALWYYTPMAIP